MPVADPLDELEALRLQIAALTQRVYHLEQQQQIPESQKKLLSIPPAEPAVSLPARPAPPPMEPLRGTMLMPPAPTTRTAAPPPFPTSPPPTSPLGPPGLPQASRRSDSMEAKIGQYWLNRVGIVAVLMGVSYFLKYAFENNWIGPRGRIVIGLFAGIALVLWSEHFRKNKHEVFSYSLKAVGIGTLYLSLWGAFQVYHLIPAATAFLAMAFITATTIALAFSQDAELLAAFSLIGGFSTPVLLSTGENHEVALFSYVCLLDIAILVIAIIKPWQRLLWGSFTGTLVLYLAWYSQYYTKDQRGLTVFFSTVFSSLFAIVPLLHDHEKSAHPDRIPLILTLLPLINATCFFLALYLMYEFEISTLTWYALALSGVYLSIGSFYKRQAQSRRLGVVHLLHIAIAVAFLTIAIPAKLHAHWITIGWLVESGALLWVSEKTKTDLLRYLASAALILGIVRLLFFDQTVTQTLLFNARFLTYVVAIAILAAIAYYGRQHASMQEMVFINAAVVSANLLALIALTWEAYDYFDRQMLLNRDHKPGFYHDAFVARGFTCSAIWLIYGAALMAFGLSQRSAYARWQALILIAVTTVKVFMVDISQLGGSYRIVSFIALGTVLLAISFAYQRDWLKLSASSETGARNPQ
jgi:uncharacterized membrane protein